MEQGFMIGSECADRSVEGIVQDPSRTLPDYRICRSSEARSDLAELSTLKRAPAVASGTMHRKINPHAWGNRWRDLYGSTAYPRN